MNQEPTNYPNTQTKVHLHFNEIVKKLEIIYFEDDFIRFKQFQLSNQNWSNETKIFFKTVKNLYSFLKDNQESLKIGKDVPPKVVVQCYLNKRLFSIVQLELLAQEKPNSDNKTTEMRRKEAEENTLRQIKIKRLQKQLAEKNIQIAALQKRVFQLEKTLSREQTEMKNLKKETKTLNDFQKIAQETINQIKYEKDNLLLNISSAIQNRQKNSRTPSFTCKTDRQSSIQNEESSNLIQTVSSKSTVDKQADQNQEKRNRKMSGPVLTPSFPIKMKLLIDHFRYTKTFTISGPQTGNRHIEKISGANLGHQIVFQNWVYPSGTSYFRLMNKQIKNNFMFVGVILETHKNDRFSYHSKECVSYNCSNGCIWSQGNSLMNSGMGRELKGGEVMTVVVSSAERRIGWYIGKRLVGWVGVGHLLGEKEGQGQGKGQGENMGLQNQRQKIEMKLHPFIGMEGVGDQVEIINDQSTVEEELSIHNLINDPINKSMIEKTKVKQTTQLLISASNRVRAASVYVEKRRVKFADE